MEGKPIFLVPIEEIRRETKVVNSRFIATLAPAASVEVAQILIDRVHKEFYDANHHVTAYIIGHGSSQTAHCSDSGEPAGSAGRPCLAVLKGSGLGDVAVVVSRYFGGNKLGIGGLVRAYSNAVRLVINDVHVARKVIAHKVMLGYGYPLVERIRQMVSAHSGLVIVEDFNLEVTMVASFPVEYLPGFDLDLAKQTSGQVKTVIVQTSEVLLPLEKSNQ